MFVDVVCREAGPCGEVSFVDGRCKSSRDWAEASLVKKLYQVRGVVGLYNVVDAVGLCGGWPVYVWWCLHGSQISGP